MSLLRGLRYAVVFRNRLHQRVDKDLSSNLFKNFLQVEDKNLYLRDLKSRGHTHDDTVITIIDGMLDPDPNQPSEDAFADLVALQSLADQFCGRRFNELMSGKDLFLYSEKSENTPLGRLEKLLNGQPFTVLSRKNGYNIIGNPCFIEGADKVLLGRASDLACILVLLFNNAISNGDPDPVLAPKGNDGRDRPDPQDTVRIEIRVKRADLLITNKVTDKAEAVKKMRDSLGFRLRKKRGITLWTVNCYLKQNWIAHYLMEISKEIRQPFDENSTKINIESLIDDIVEVAKECISVDDQEGGGPGSITIRLPLILHPDSPQPLAIVRPAGPRRKQGGAELPLS